MAVALGVAACAGPGAGKTAYVGAELFDGTGAPVTHDAIIIVADGRIEAVGPPDLVSVPRGAEEIRLDGRWVVPGFIDAHAHAERGHLREYLAWGITAIRDAGGVQDSIIFLRADVSDGTVMGPRLYVSGAPVDGPPASGGPATVVRTPADARRAVGDRVLVDATQIVTGPKLTRRLLEPLLDEARALATPVAAHLGKVDALSAAGLGVSAIELLSGIVEASGVAGAAVVAAHDDFYRGWNLVARSWRQVDSAAAQRIASALVEAQVTLIPSLIQHEAWAHLDDAGYQDALTALLGAGDLAWDLPAVIRGAAVSNADFVAFRSGRPAQDRFVRLFRRAGGQVAAGSNSPNPLLPPGLALHQELALLVAAGLSAEQALLAATRDAARLLGADSIGVLQPGAVADFVVLAADPLTDIGNTRRVTLVVSRGNRYDPSGMRRQ